MNATDTPKVWIACLASYNAGRLIGEWADATDIDLMYEAKDRVALAAVKAAKEAGEYPVYFGDPEEFAIHDYDNFPHEIVSELGEYPSWERVAAIGAMLEDVHDREKFAAWLKFVDSISDVDADQMRDRMDEQCVGSGYESEEDYARERSLELGLGGVQAHWPKPNSYGFSHTEHVNIIEELENYIDWDTVAREMFDHGTLTLVDGYVFDSEM